MNTAINYKLFLVFIFFTSFISQGFNPLLNKNSYIEISNEDGGVQTGYAVLDFDMYIPDPYQIYIKEHAVNTSDTSNNKELLVDKEQINKDQITKIQETQDQIDKDPIDSESIDIDLVDQKNDNITESQAKTESKDLKVDNVKIEEKPTEKPVEKSVEANSHKSYNQLVLEAIHTYDGGNYPYLLNDDYTNYNGVTKDIYYQGKIFLKANPSGNKASHCVGITFEVFFKAMQEWNKQQGLSGNTIKNLSYSELQDFMLTWYVANGSKENSNLTVAVEKYGLGKRIYDLEKVMPGDFIDFSRDNNTGHTVVFLGWKREENKIVGLKYWSSQGSTNGIAYKTEYFNVQRNDGTKYGNMIIDNLYIARINP